MNKTSSEVVEYEIRRKAPPPPIRFASYGNLTQSSGDYHQTSRYVSQLDPNTPNSTPKTIIDKLMWKERQYIEQLNTQINEMKVISTRSCHKVPCLERILRHHYKLLSDISSNPENPLRTVLLFQKHRLIFDLYVQFARDRWDFSYLVSDLGDMVLENFKARLLEYNFSLSQLKGLVPGGAEMTLLASEELVKNTYQTIHSIIKISPPRNDNSPDE